MARDDAIVRLYEAHGARGPVEVSLGLPVASAAECSGLEEDLAEACLRDGRLRFA